MSKPGDTLVLYLLIGLFLYLIVRNLPFFVRKKELNDDQEIRGVVPDILREHGYEVVRSKEKIPLWIDVNGETLESRLYIDYVARCEEEWYIVIVARERKPIRMSGAGLRDFFLSYYLLYQPDGILYVDREKRTVKVITFDFPDCSLKPTKSRALVWGGVLGFVILVVLFLWLL